MTPPADESVKTPPRVSVVVVSHNQLDGLRRCLTSLNSSQGHETFQLIVVENGSTDGSARLDLDYPDVQWVKLPKNFGLTKAWNLGWRAADAEYVLFLHADTEVAPDAILRLVETLDANADAVAVCPLLVNEAGSPAPQLGNFPPDAQWRPAQPGNEPAAVEYPRGAALMVRVFYIKAIRKIDERYGQFGPDADLSMQIKRSGRKILLVPGATVRHDGRRTYSSLEKADLALARSVFIGKFEGAGAGMKARIGAIFSALLGFRFGELKHLIAGEKVDGTQ